VNLLLRPAQWFFWNSRSQGQDINQRRSDQSTPTESDDDELVVVLVIQHAAGH
jgi:hypothetical protein